MFYSVPRILHIFIILVGFIFSTVSPVAGHAKLEDIVAKGSARGQTSQLALSNEEIEWTVNLLLNGYSSDMLGDFNSSQLDQVSQSLSEKGENILTWFGICCKAATLSGIACGFFGVRRCMRSQHCLWSCN